MSESQNHQARMSVRFPLRLSGGLNAREHHMALARRVKAERFATLMHLQGMKHIRPAGTPTQPIVVLLSRIAAKTQTRPLDDDNLRGSLKGVRDEVASWLGLDDGSPLLRFFYAQRRADAWGVEIEIEWTVRGEE